MQRLPLGGLQLGSTAQHRGETLGDAVAALRVIAIAQWLRLAGWTARSCRHSVLNTVIVQCSGQHGSPIAFAARCASIRSSLRNLGKRAACVGRVGGAR